MKIFRGALLIRNSKVVRNILSMIVSETSFVTYNSPQAPLNLHLLAILITLQLLAHFKPKTRATELKKTLKICLS